MTEAKFELGEILKDKVTSFQGVVMGRTDYFTGCIHYGLCSQKLKKDGGSMNWEWFDESRVVKIAGKKRVTRESRVATSGSFPNAPEM
jgi:hypothetical protein